MSSYSLLEGKGVDGNGDDEIRSVGGVQNDD